MSHVAAAWKRAGFNIVFVADLTYGFIVYPPTASTTAVPVAMLPIALEHAGVDEQGAAIAAAILDHGPDDADARGMLAESPRPPRWSRRCWRPRCAGVVTGDRRRPPGVSPSVERPRHPFPSQPPLPRPGRPRNPFVCERRI